MCFAGRLRHLALRECHRAERIIAQDARRLVPLAQHEHSIRLASDVLSGLGLQISVQTLDAARKANPVVPLVEGPDVKIPG